MDDVLTPQEEARCQAMVERAEVHVAEAEGFEQQLQRLRKKPAVAEAIAVILALHICNRARCAALDCSAPSLEETFARHSIIDRAALNQPLSPLKEACN